MKYYIQSYEFMCNRAFPSCSKARGSRVDQSFTILDLKGASMKLVGKQVYNFIQIASKIGQDNYPEILGRLKYKLKNILFELYKFSTHKECS